MLAPCSHLRAKPALVADVAQHPGSQRYPYTLVCLRVRYCVLQATVYVAWDPPSTAFLCAELTGFKPTSALLQEPHLVAQDLAGLHAGHGPQVPAWRM